MSVSFDIEQKEHTGSPLFYVKVMDGGVVISQFELCLGLEQTMQDAVQQAPLVYAEQVALGQKTNAKY